MRENELRTLVAIKELKSLTHEQALEWASKRLKEYSDILYTILSGMSDIEENYKTMRHLAKANEHLAFAIRATGSAHLNKIPDSMLDNEDEICINLTARGLIEKTNKVRDFMTVEMKKHDKMADRPDKMADFVKEFFTELDNFEEEMYNVI